MNVATVFDVAPGICTCPSGAYPDTGIIVSGNPMLQESGKPVAMTGGLSIVSFSCGTGIIVGGGNLMVSGIPVAKTGFTVTGGGCPTAIIAGTSTIISI